VVIAGAGAQGYEFAVRYLLGALGWSPPAVVRYAGCLVAAEGLAGLIVAAVYLVHALAAQGGRARAGRWAGSATAPRRGSPSSAARSWPPAGR
jgi:hypothetical protein